MSDIVEHIKQLERRIEALERFGLSLDSDGDLNTRTGTIWLNKNAGTKYGIGVNMTDGALEIRSDNYVRFIESDNDTLRREWSLNGALDSGWTAVTLQGTWVNYDTTWGIANLTYIRKIDDVVYMRGLIKNGTINTTAFTLPTGWRPSLNQILETSSSGVRGELRVQTNGAVVPFSGSTTWFSLSTSFTVG